MYSTFTGQKYTNFNYLQNIFLFFVINTTIRSNNVFVSFLKNQRNNSRTNIQNNL